MKFHVILPLLVLAACSTPFVFGEEGSSEEGGTSQSGFGGIGGLIQKYFGYVQRIMKFKDLFNNLENKPEDLTMEKLQEAFQVSIEEGQKCFGDALKDSKELLEKLQNDIKDVVKPDGSDGSDGSENGSENGADRSAENPIPNLGGFDGIKKAIEMFRKFSKLFSDPNLKDDFRELKGKVMEGFQTAKGCFLDSYEKEVGADNFKTLGDIWQETKQQ